MNDAGKVAFTPKGDYSSTVTYEYLDTVVYDGNAYAALKTTTGNQPEDDSEYWALLARGGTSVPVATEDTMGAVKASDDIGVDSDAKMILRTDFAPQENLTELESGESRNTFFGKIAKAVSDMISHVGLKASSDKAGHLKISNSAAITTAGEYALDAREKNASISGTLANKVSEYVIIKPVKIYSKTTIAAGHGATLFFAIPTIKGYKCVLGIGGTSSNGSIVPIRCSNVPSTDGTMQLFYKNEAGTAQEIEDLYCNMIFVKDI